MSNLVVETSSGPVRGILQGGVAAWRGIPYAAPPVGPLRFRAPEPVGRWTEVRDASRFGPVAMQARDAPTAVMSGIGPKVPVSEDCLVLNVVSPAADGRRRPVAVWLHGGAFIVGSGSTPLYDATSFAARHDIVVVTLNYRLGLFGFLYLGDLVGPEHASGNHALLDQIAALRWVVDNIAGFGGDPEAITLMGQSAGAIGLGTLLAMPGAAGRFQRAILQSGASSLSVPSRADATEQARRVLVALDIDPASPASARGVLDVPAERLLSLQESMIRSHGLGAFTPHIDGVSLLEAPIDAVRAGRAAPVPLLAGSNRDEWALFDLLLGAPVTDALVTRVRESRGQDGLDRLLAAYQAARADGSPEGARRDLAGDVAFRLPTARMADAQAARGLPVWMYRFDWASTAFDGRLGAAHAIELPFTWSALHQQFAELLIGDREAARPLAALMHDAWAAFIRTGDPNGAGLPAWPNYQPPGRATMIFDRESRVVDDPDRERTAAWVG